MTVKEVNTKIKIGGASTLEKDMNGRKSRESIGSPNTLERRNKRFSTTRQTSVEVPYARLLDSPSKKVLKQDSTESQGVAFRRGSDSNKSQNNTLRVSPPKTSISDSRLTGEVNVEDELEVYLNNFLFSIKVFFIIYNLLFKVRLSCLF